MEDLSEFSTSVVRLFPDYAGSPVWFSEPVPYEVSRLSGDLVRDLQVWEESYYRGLDKEFAWRSDAMRSAFTVEGKRLARWLADELGDEFSVEYDNPAMSGKHRVRGSGPPRNPSAAAAFRQLANDAQAEHDRIRRIADQARREGGTLEWRAYY